jgi:aminoglycoside phosphotransferase (APT) family kinase protein
MARHANLDMETAAAALIERRARTSTMSAYTVRTPELIVEALERFFRVERPRATVSGVQRLGGGASKEQFLFDLQDVDSVDRKYVLRMDPRAAITQTDRRREFHVLRAVQGHVPAPKPVAIDPDGTFFENPAIVMEFVPGVTKPSASGSKPTGMGVSLGGRLRVLLREPFLDCLVRIHAFDWRRVELPGFEAPIADSKQAARWALNYWRGLWEIDLIETRPIFSLATKWLMDHLPECEDVVLTHGDYRTGNFLFDEQTGRITAILDWELARIGDFHEDLAWFLMEACGTYEDGQFRAGDLFGREEFLAAYETASGRKVNRVTLHYYEVLTMYKAYVIDMANGLSAAKRHHNHQDILLTYLGALGPLWAGELQRLISTEVR